MKLQPRHFEHTARLVSTRGRSRSDGLPLESLQTRGDRVPLFLVPGVGGDLLALRAMVRHLHPAQPVYGLRAGPDLPKGGTLRLESLAATCIDAIRQVRPTGPYLLAAYSAGGMLAYEVAQQLRASKEQVALLAMIDAEVPPEIVGPASWTPVDVLRFPKNLAFWVVDDLLASNMAEFRVRVRSKLRLLRASARNPTTVVSGGRRQADVRDRLGVPLMSEAYIPWLEAYVDALSRYHPDRYPGRIVLLRARALPLFRNLRPDRGWRAFAGDDVDVHVIAGDHINILREPRVRLLAAALTRVIDRALPPAASAGSGRAVARSG